MIRSIWGESGENTNLGRVSKWAKCLKYLVIAARLERATYCLEGLSSVFSPVSLFLKILDTYSFCLGKYEFPNSSYIQPITTKMQPTWGESGEFAFFPAHPKQPEINPVLIIPSGFSFTILNLNTDQITTSRGRRNGANQY